MTAAGAREAVEVHLTAEPLDVAAAFRSVSRPDCGGVGLFCGVVRDHDGGQAVAALEYEAWEDEAPVAMRAAAETVLADHPDVRAVYVAHRTGQLTVGEVSVVVAASAPHRAEAFAATRALIDRVKEQAPIWKREEFADGTVAWPGTDVGGDAGTDS